MKFVGSLTINTMKIVLSKNNLTHSFVTVSGAVAATVASTQASVVQITLTGNKLTNSSDTLNADLTGDGTSDITFGGVEQKSSAVIAKINGGAYVYAGLFVTINKAFYAAVAAFNPSGGVGRSFQSSPFKENIKYLNPLSFTDARINGGALTQGYLEVNAFNTSYSQHTVALTRLVFDDASTTLGNSGLSTSATYTEFVAAAVPEPSSLGLLALGAGGLVARRRRQAA